MKPTETEWPIDPGNKFIPKVGEWCEHVILSNDYVKLFYVGISSTGYRLFQDAKGKALEFGLSTEFRPIKSERDVFIELASCVPFCGKENIKNHYGDLFDAGFKAPESNDE